MCNKKFYKENTFKNILRFCDLEQCFSNLTVKNANSDLVAPAEEDKIPPF